MQPTDLMRAFELGLVHPEHLHEESQSFFTRYAAGREFCFALGNDICSGYALAHPWDDTVPDLKGPVAAQHNAPTTLYVHDIVVEPEFQCLGYGSKQITMWQRQTPYRSIQLVSVNRSERFWLRHGFARIDRPAPPSYGADACVMRWVA